MYQAINKRVIAIPQDTEQTTESGIVLANSNNPCVPFKVVATTDLTKDLQDKVVYVESRWLNHQLPKLGKNGEKYVTLPSEEILAIAE